MLTGALADAIVVSLIVECILCRFVTHSFHVVQKIGEFPRSEFRIQLRDICCSRQVRDVNTSMLADLVKYWQVRSHFFP
jgi:hypothetical protein